MTGCKSLCEKYRGYRSNIIGRYASGQKRCQICDIFLNYEGIYCPCCGYKLRTHPRNTFFKQKLRSLKAKQEKALINK